MSMAWSLRNATARSGGRAVGARAWRGTAVYELLPCGPQSVGCDGTMTGGPAAHFYASMLSRATMRQGHDATRQVPPDVCRPIDAASPDSPSAARRAPMARPALVCARRRARVADGLAGVCRQGHARWACSLGGRCRAHRLYGRPMLAGALAQSSLPVHDVALGQGDRRAACVGGAAETRAAVLRAWRDLISEQAQQAHSLSQ